MKLLIIDDDAVDRMMIKKNLNQSIHELDITEANNADDGIKCLRNNAYDVILLDYQLPTITGLDFIKSVSQPPEYSSEDSSLNHEEKPDTLSGNAAIVVLSHNEDETLAIQCMAAGAQDFIVKNELSISRLTRSIMQAKERHNTIKKIQNISQELQVSNQRFLKINQKLQLIFDSTIDGMMTLNNAGIIQSCNKPSEAIFSYNNEEMIGRPISELIPATKDGKSNSFSEYYFSRTPVRDIGISTDVTGIKKDSSNIHLRMGITEADWLGEPLFVAIIQDISIRKANEEMKNNFISMVNHELRTPLTSIHAGIELISVMHSQTLPQPALDLVKIIQSNTEKIIKIVNDILDMSKIESGQLDVILTRMNVEEIIIASVNENETYAKKHQVKLTLASINSDLFINADPTRLRQVMDNLLSNAIKYTPSGGQVVISANFDNEKKEITISVTDEGPGIPEHFREKLFDRFTQADDTLTRKMTGTGLGLNIAKRIIELHQGIIGADFSLPKGTSLYFILPSK